MRKYDKGQVTIFAAIVLLAVIILAGILVDISRINAGRTVVKRAVESAAISMLADYKSRLKDDYGIFALPLGKQEDLQDRFEEYLTCNLSIPCEGEPHGNHTDLFGFRIERVSITPIFNLSENKVMKRQILEHMKYRAPAKLAEGFIERLSAVKDVGTMSEAYKKKVGIDKLLAAMDKSQQKLKKSIDGSGDGKDKFVNGFNIGGTWEAAYNSFNSISESLSAIKSDLDRLNEKIAAETQDNSQGDSQGDSINNVETTVKILESLMEERTVLKKRESEVVKSLNQAWDEIRNKLTADYIKSNESAVIEIKKIVEKGKKAKEAISELEGYLGENFQSEGSDIPNHFSDYSKQFKEQLEIELDGLKKLILDGQKAEEMLGNVTGNSNLLNCIINMMDKAGINNIPGGTDTKGLPSELLDLVRGYSKISYDYSKPDRGDGKDDPRKGKAEAIKELIAEKILKDVSYKLEGIDESDLPSRTILFTDSYFQEDADYISGIDGENDENLESKADEAIYEGNLGDIGNEADLYNEDGNFQENALGFISDIGKMVGSGAISLRDNIYLNEYIMGTFKNSVPVIKNGNEDVSDINLNGIEKKSCQTFYDSEVEYVLHGNASQKLNNILTKGEILLVRIGLNTLHVYTDANKKTLAASIASAVAGWWTGGAGIPIISNLIICGWGIGEAVIDLKDLMDGKSVPIYKLKGDWKLDIGIGSASGPKTDKRLHFNYHDYLRLLLLTKSENKKLDRIEDLIQLNMGMSDNGFRMSGCNTFVRVEAEVSVKYMFAVLPFVRKVTKTEDGRYVYRVLVYEGYQ